MGNFDFLKSLFPDWSTRVCSASFCCPRKTDWLQK